MLTFTTADGATFVFDFGNGDYTYTVIVSAGAGSETFGYTIEDGDTNPSSAVLTIDVPETICRHF